MKIIETKNLNLWYGPSQALKNINLDIEEKSITALIGPSGCGKSTYLRTLNRMNDLIDGVRIEGQVLYEGQDIFSPKIDVNGLRRDIGMVFQKPNPFLMSIYDNIAYGPRTNGIKSRAKLDEIVEKSLRNAALWDEVGCDFLAPYGVVPQETDDPRDLTGMEGNEQAVIRWMLETRLQCNTVVSLPQDYFSNVNLILRPQA